MQGSKMIRGGTTPLCGKMTPRARLFPLAEWRGATMFCIFHPQSLNVCIHPEKMSRQPRGCEHRTGQLAFAPCPWITPWEDGRCSLLLISLQPVFTSHGLPGGWELWLSKRNWIPKTRKSKTHTAVDHHSGMASTRGLSIAAERRPRQSYSLPSSRKG